MKFFSLLRVETARLLRAGTSRIVLAAASLCPLAGYTLYHPAGTGTTAAQVLANPLMTGALGGMFLFAALALLELNRVRKGRMEAITYSVISPMVMSAAQTAALLIAAALCALLISVLYLPYTWLRLGEGFSLGEYSRFAAIFLLPALMMGVVTASALYQTLRRAELSFLCFAALMLAGLGPWNGGTYLLYWIDLSSVGFSGDMGNTSIYRMALYSRLLWLCLFGGAWVGSLLCVRTHGKGLLSSLAYHLRRVVHLPLLAAALLAAGGAMYLAQPYMDHEPPMALDMSGAAGGMAVTMGGEESSGLVVDQTAFDLKLNPQRGSIGGEARYQIENPGGEERDCLLEIAPGYTVDRVTVNGEEIPFTDLQNDAFILIKNVALTLPARQRMEVAVAYHGIPQIPAHAGALVLYYEITPEYVSLGGHHVIPGFQGAETENCTFSGRVTLPGGMELIAAGQTPQLSQSNADGTATWQVRGRGLRPTLFAGDYIRVPIADVGFPVWFCYGKNHRQEFERLDIETLLRDTLAYCVRQYDPLPYTEDAPLNIVMSSAHMMGGGADENLSFMGETYFTAANLSDPAKGASAAEIIAHEIIHQWWGVQRYLMDSENTDWSSEALTCYATYRMMKERRGEAYAQRFYVDVWREKYQNMQDNFYLRNPAYLAMLPQAQQAAIGALIFDASTYAKAPLQVLKAERLVGGEEKMDDILRGLFQNGGTELPPFVTWQDFLDACGLTEAQLALEGGENLG